MNRTDNSLGEVGVGLRKYIRKNPTDVAGHLIYADWLDEIGRHKEAEVRRKYAEPYSRLAMQAKDATRLALLHSHYATPRYDGNSGQWVREPDFDNHLEAASTHRAASALHDKVAVIAYKMRSPTLALHHGILALRHGEAMRDHEEGEPLDREEFRAKPDDYVHSRAAEYHSEGDNPQLATLHQKAANILRNRRN